jgi:ABC-2 type transport system ATP-binding protein
VDAIRTEGLTKSFGGRAAVDGLTLSVAEGEIFGLVGPDGAGKTTTLRLLAAIMDPSAGDAWVDGRHVVREAEALKDSIGYMSQRFGLYPDLSVAENIDFYADIYNVPRRGRAERIGRLLDFSHLGPFRRRLAGNLSGGMKQKLGLACALVHTPRVLLLDEPTNGVDPVSRRDFWRILYQLLREKVTIFVSTAYLDEAERCSRLALLDRGRVLALGTPEEIKRQAGGAGEMTLEDVFISMGSGAGGAAAGLPRRPVPAVSGPEPGPGGVSRPPTHAAPAVVVENLEKHFGRFVAVNQVSFEVAPGEVFGFLGPNGAGKSTTIRMLCGILAPSGGRGTVAGFDLGAQAEAIKTRIGYMSQRFSLYEDLTVEENIDFYSGIYRVPAGRKQARKDWVIEMAGLGEHRRSRTAILSSGWKQRLALGCAILHEPPILFLDEPTSGVDPVSRRRFWDLIYELSGRGVTVFVTTHYMDEAEYCDRLGLVYRGELIALGAPAALKSELMHEDILEVRCDRPYDLMGEIEGLPGVREVALFGNGLHVVADDSAAALQGLRRMMEARGRGGAAPRKIAPTLEDVFVSLIEAHDRAAAPQAEVRR